MAFIPSVQQQAVIDWTRNGTGSAFVEAVAGAGKTTTLIQALAETNGSVAFCAYNKKISDEIKAKTARLNFGNRVRVGTFHSFGLNAWRRAYPDVMAGPEAANTKRDTTLARYRDIKSPRKLDNFALKLAGLAKQRALGLFGEIDDVSEWYKIVEHFDLAFELECDDTTSFEPGVDQASATVDNGIKLAIRTLKYHRETGSKLVDFDDMIYLPVVSNIRLWQNDWVFVDEAQDTNPARRALARKMLSPRGRAVFVGDRHQAIYGFTGADNDAIERIVSEFNCQTLPLTVTYRCPKEVVKEAQRIVGHIQAHETAPVGKVSTIDFNDFLVQYQVVKTKTAPADLGALTAADAILCRKTKPLVSLAFQLIKANIPCHVEGREIGAGLIKMLNRFKTDDVVELRDRLTKYGRAESAKLSAKGKETQAEALMDRVETILVVMDSQPPATTVTELRQRIANMFQDADGERRPTLTLSTVHKSKGREWPRVFILGRNDYMPSPWARQEWQQEQERNLIYVAVTRAQQELVLINNVEQPKGS